MFELAISICDRFRSCLMVFVSYKRRPKSVWIDGRDETAEGGERVLRVTYQRRKGIPRHKCHHESERREEERPAILIHRVEDWHRERLPIHWVQCRSLPKQTDSHSSERSIVKRLIDLFKLQACQQKIRQYSSSPIWGWKPYPEIKLIPNIPKARDAGR